MWSEVYGVCVGSSGGGGSVGGVCVICERGGGVCFRCCVVIILFLLFVVRYLCPSFVFVVCLVVWIGVRGRVEKFPCIGIVGGEVLVKVFGHAGVEIVALFSECWA